MYGDGPIGDALYPFEHLVDVAVPTRHQLTTFEAGEWRVVRAGRVVAKSDVVTSLFEAHYPGPGEYAVEVIVAKSTKVELYAVSARRVRREIRSLPPPERERFLSALHTVYSTPDDEGLERFGPDFLSIAWLVREHLYGAASRECDHWHDDAGFMNHHVAITWQLEKSLTSVDSRTAVPYWDYTFDAAAYGKKWATSPIFDWFGPANPNNTDHVVDAGRWGYTGIMEHARAYSNVTNPYGLLRSPWNTNKVPFVMRSSYVLGEYAGGFSTFPSCEEFSEALMANVWIGQTFNQLNGGFHGPVHIMLGGYWGWDRRIWNSATTTKVVDSNKKELNAVMFLLFAKFLWRQGYSRCPEKCSKDVPQSECRCDCPTEILGGRSPSDVLNTTGAFALEAYFGGQNVSSDEMLRALCQIGFPGELFTSAAPQDPLFWPLHGNAERFLQYARILKARGILDYDETWGYEHSPDLASDTGVVCDWTGVVGMHMPECTRGTCPGHREADILPFDNLFPDLLTNGEFYKLIHPYSTAMPYVYDSLTSWPGCDGGVIGDQSILAAAATKQAD
ncbi:hypothetical protein CTAYLR_007058 [Chrysophaeum taylorii]|uniref:Tyrosinase copper-binding domain-containing protein n=1 Tax=Chrysophaeum taylorii TaxID=2483200 RepID=A0AAD7UKW7_9STRA|nr:hypothetical protein CTAYLR_007058 [Chrysophaeum taylorii]